MKPKGKNIVVGHFSVKGNCVTDCVRGTNYWEQAIRKNKMEGIIFSVTLVPTKVKA